MGLLSNFWNRQHCTGSIVYRPAFMRDMATNGPYFSELLLYAILFAGSAFTEEAAAARNLSEVNATGRQFRVKFEQILHSSGSQILFKKQSSKMHPVELWKSASLLHGQLESWRENMPEHLQIDLDDPVGSAILPHTLSLMALYHSLVILVYRPFLSEGHLTTALETAALEAFSNCATAALDIHQILRIYKQNFCFKTSPYFISYATYVSATIHVRMAAQQTPSSQAHMCLRSCMEILNIQQRWSHGPKRTMRILIGLMQRLDVHVGDFVAMQPIRCHVDEPKENNTVETSADQQKTAKQMPDRLSFDESSSFGDPNLPQDFQATGGWQLTDFDIDQIMDSFTFEPPPPSHQGFPITPQDMSQSSFSQCGMDDGQLASQDLMIFDDLFGFDSS
ncbi:hypothetical protein ACLX1H_001209 [Fusarium chlamydosporum]